MKVGHIDSDWNFAHPRPQLEMSVLLVLYFVLPVKYQNKILKHHSNKKGMQKKDWLKADAGALNTEHEIILIFVSQCQSLRRYLPSAASSRILRYQLVFLLSLFFELKYHELLNIWDS